MKINHLFLIFSAIFITSCGGGGGGGSDSGPAPTPAATVSLSSDSSSVSINSSVTLTWSSSNASGCSASGDWSGSKATSGNESVVIQSAGNNSFGLSCSGSGGSGQASVSVTGEGFTGVVVDGYIRDATVYLDANASFIQDGDEQATTSDAAGTFTLGQVDANLVASNGIDVDSNNALENFSLFQKASGELDFRVVTPITSSAYYLEGTETINTILGLDTSIDINSTDPVANMNDSDAYKVLYEKGVQITTLIFSLQSALNDINALQETSETYFQEFTKTLEVQYELNSEVVDIETPAFIDAYVDAVLASKATSLGTTNTSNSKNALYSLIPVISVRNEVSLTTALSNFSTGKFITDFKDMAKGSASANLVSTYVNDVNSLIAEDQNVDLNDLVVLISLLDDSATVDEDNSVDIAVLSNDTLSTHTYGFSIETSAPTNGQVLLNTDDTISYVPEANFNGSDAFIYTVLVDDRSGSANVNVTINPVNDTPIINDLVGSMAISEGQTSVLTVSASDVEGDTLTYSLTGTDAALLSISSAGVITFNTAPVYATKSFYSITVNVSDETDSASQALIITITNPTEGAPVISGLATTISVQENLTSVVTVSASDPDGDSLTYSLTGTDASSLSISSSGVITFNSAPDYETKTSYSVTVNVSDGTTTTNQPLTINITNTNDNAPVISGLPTSISVAENQTAVITVTASDDDGDSLTYSLLGTDASSLSISSSGVITFNTAPDYETKSSYSITVNVSDATNSTSRVLTINITDTNDNAPVISGLASTILVAENQTGVITVSASDPDNDTLTYSLSGTDAASLSISSSGVITFNTAPDYETKSSYSITVNVSDATNNTGQGVIINISNVNDNSPVISGLLTSISVDENQTAVLTVSASDPDGDSLTYSLSGTDAASLSISSSGVITFNSAPDYETKSNYSITVNVSDGINSISQSIDISITDVDEAGNPPVISGLSSSISVAENQTAVVTISASDAEGGTLTYSLTGTDAGSLSISSSGVVTFNSAPDYETKTSFVITVNVSDGTNTTSQALSINITNLNDNTPAISGLSSSVSVAENQTAVVTVSASDTDGDTLTYSLSGTDSSSFSFSSSGVITFNSAPDFESKSSYTFTVNVSDGTNTSSQALTVNVSNVNEAPTISSLSSSITVAEGQTSVVTVSASDPEGDTLTYSLSGTDTASLSISSSGVITFNTAPDYETKTSYYITVNVSDGTATTSQALTINVSNVSEAPSISGLSSSISVAENQTAVVTVSASDPDGDSLTYSLSGTDAASLSISSSGVITFNSAPDYETKTSYSITVIVSDGTNTASQSLTINITDVNEAPIISGLASSISVNENQTAVVTVSASDPESSSLTYSLSGTDASSLSINSSGVITFNSAPDYETKTSYSITVNVSDGTNTTSQAVTISITNVNEAPTISGLSSTVTVAENQTSVVTVSASDSDGDSLSYSLSGTDASSFSINSSGVITFNSAPDYETKNSFSITVNVNDGTDTTSQALTVNVSNVNEAPTISSLSSSITVAEGQTSVVTVSASDPEGESLTYSLTGTDASSLSINSSGVITFNSAPDYETKTSYSVTVNVSDGTSTTSQALTINISNINEAPTISGLASSITVNENQTSVVTVSASDPDSSISYSVSGTDASAFSINSSGVITFNSAPDYETKTSYSITVNVSDGSNTTSQSVTVSITNLNDNNPSISGLSSSVSIDENDSSVLTVSASDADGESISYSLTGTDASSLSINSSGVLTFNSAPDYETKTSYSITVNVSDGTNTTSQELTININDITESGLAPGSYDPNVYVTAETLNGGTGNDTMYGYDGDDTINGNDGDDILWGGAGADILTGGNGADRFAVKEACTPNSGYSNISVVTDFTDGEDKILLLDGLAFSDITIFVADENYPENKGPNLAVGDTYLRSNTHSLLIIKANSFTLTSDDFETGSSGSSYCD